MIEVDARPILANGGEPFDLIMEALSKLKENEDFVVYAPFEPTPLESLLSSQGFTYDVSSTDSGDFKVVFRRAY